MTPLRDSLRKVRRASRALAGRDVWYGVQLQCDFIRLGNERAQWPLCPDGLGKESVVYSLGVGEDVSFDLELIRRFGCTVHAFDPTPRSMDWLRSQSLPEQFVFHPYGVADHDGSCRFQPPENPSYLSHTVIDRHSPWPALVLPVQRLASIMGALGHDHLDVLKMDIEGAEYGVLADLLASRIPVRQLLVEFHHRWPEIGAARTRTAIDALNRAGYRIFSVSPSGEEYGFLAGEVARRASV